MFCLFFLVAGVSVHSDLLWLLCPFGVGCQLSGSQGGGISDSASRGKGDFPFPHEDRRDVTLWRLYVFYCGRMDGGSVSGSRPAVPTGVLLGGVFGIPAQTNLSGRLVFGRCVFVFRIISKKPLRNGKKFVILLTLKNKHNGTNCFE